MVERRNSFRRARPRRRRRSLSTRERSADVGAWIRGRGIKINERGRIPATVVDQYEAAH